MNLEELLQAAVQFLPQKEPPWEFCRKVPCGAGKLVEIEAVGLKKDREIPRNLEEIVREEVRLKNELSYKSMVEHVNERVTGDALIEQNEQSTNESSSTKTSSHQSLISLLERLLSVPCYKLKNSQGNFGAEIEIVPEFVPNEESEWNPNIRRPLCLLDCGGRGLCVVNNKTETDCAGVVTLWDCTAFSPAVLSLNHSKLLFVVYQMLSGLQYCLEHSFVPMDLSMDCFLIDSNGWIQLDLTECAKRDSLNEVGQKMDSEEEKNVEENEGLKTPLSAVSVPKLFKPPSMENCVIKNASKFDKLCTKPIYELTTDWTTGRLTNFEYIMCLNRFAGRRMNDPMNHPVFPWVCDFSLPEGGWRDLTKTKYRLAKGDAQLEQSYRAETTGGTAAMPKYHVSEILCEIGYYMYKARITSKQDLCKYVRSKWVPEEYPGSIRRLYEWTPGECIPEFYCDPEIFESIHKDMPDLSLPTWCPSGEEFVAWHRQMLECDWVSQRLHHWIDLVFGYKLSGEAAVKAKNVQLSLVDRHEDMKKHGILQLFLKPHPAKKLLVGGTSGVRTMEDAVNLVMNPLYELSQKPAESFEINSESFDLVSLTEAIYRTQRENQKVNAVEDCLASLGVVLVELCLTRDMRCLPRSCHWKERYPLAKRMFNEKLAEVPRCLRRGIRVLLQLGIDDPGRKSALTRLQLTPGLLLQPLVDVFPFPHFLPLLHECLGTLVKTRRKLSTWFMDSSSENLCPETLRDLAETQVRTLAKFLEVALPNLSLDLIKIVAEFARQLFSNPWTSVLAVWSLFNCLAQSLGQTLTNQVFGKALCLAYDVELPCTQKHLKLYHRSFLLQLCVRMGTRVFVREIVPFLVEAAAGIRDHLAMDDAGYVDFFKESAAFQVGVTDNFVPQHFHRHLSEAIDTTENDSTNEFGGQRDRNKSDTHPGNVQQFDIELDETFVDSDSPVFENTNPDSREKLERSGSVVKYTPREYGDLPANQSEAFLYDESLEISENVQNRTECSNSEIKSTTSGFEASDFSISAMARESLIWLSHRLGPVLTARHLTRDLLRMMGLCYGTENLAKVDQDAGESGLYNTEPGRDLDVKGDVMAFKIVDCLVEIAGIYGDAFLLLHYFPYCSDLIQQGSRRFGAKVEPGLLSSIVLVTALFPYLTDKQLMDNLQETLVDSVLFPAVRLASSLRVMFSDQRLRELLVWKLARAIYVIGVRVGGDNFKRHMNAPLQRLLCTYDLLYKRTEENGVNKVERRLACENEPIKDQKLMEQLQATFSPELVSRLYKLFSGLCGRRYFLLSLPNSDLIMALIESENPGLIGGTAAGSHWVGSPMANEPFGKNRVFSGNRLLSTSGLETIDNSPVIYDLNDDQTEPAIYKKLPPSKRHLRGNWLAHWEHELGRRDKEEALSINQIKLLTFVGHSSAVKQIVVLDNENSFLSGSQDKTIRLWSLRSFGDGAGRKEAQWTYKWHMKAILDVCLVDSVRLVASTDNIMHIWDPFMGKTVREMDWTGPVSSGVSSGEIVPVTLLKSFQSPSSAILAAGNDVTLKFFDLRQAKWANELKLSPLPLGSVKVLGADPEGRWAAVGHSTGHVTVMDLRTGKVLASKRVADMEIAMIESCGRDNFLLGLHDNPMTVWNALDCTLKSKLPGSSENVPCVAPYCSRLICCTQSNKLRSYSALTSEATFTESKLRSDVFSGSVSALSVLNLNRLILLGSSNGGIQLMC